MASLDALKAQISLHDLAERLGLERPGGSGNYRSPHHDDKNPSLSILANDRHWRDFSGDEHAKGSCIDLVMYVRGDDFQTAVKWLRDEYNIPADPPPDRPREQQSTPEWIAERCFDPAKLDRAREYLTGERAIDEGVVGAAIAARAVGFNDYTSPKRQPGDALYGGPAVAFIVRSLNPGRVMAVDTRYLDPKLNGGVKTQCMGEKFGQVWTSSLKRLERASSVYLVESPINALSVESANLHRSAAVAIRGTGNAGNIDFRFLRGKRVIVCMDDDAPDDKGRCPGAEAAWTLHERLLAIDVTAMLIDHDGWEDQGWNDINDVLQSGGGESVAIQLKRLQPWVIPGLPGQHQPGRKSRVFLPAHDAAQYWRFRAKEDFISCVKRESTDDDTGEKKIEYQDVCGFRLAGLSRVRIASYISTTTGEEDPQPETVYSVSVQSPRHGNRLVREVFGDKQLYKLDKWEGFGPVYAPGQFKRLLNILERTTHLGARDAINFVGLAWRDGKPVVNEGQDCYFREPAKQCPYHNLQFPSGTQDDARRVISAYQSTFRNNAALQLLVWAMGAHLKAFLGFWPHMMIQADKGAGKTTLIKRLESTIAFTMFSSESIKTLFRMLTSVSYTSHPVGWEEFSTLKQTMIDEAVSNLQQTYQFAFTRRGSEMTEYLLSAPVLLAGEDVPVRSLLGKIVRSDLTGKKGDLLPHELPRFPVLEWLQYLTRFDKRRMLEEYERVRLAALDRSRASGDDDGAVRMAGNYAALLLAWKLLSDFAGLPLEQGGFVPDLVRTMNEHIGESSGDRQPWVWIMDLLLSEIDRGEFRHPYILDTVDVGNRLGVESLLIRPSHVMDHIAHTPALRDRWNALPIKSARVFKRQLAQAGVVLDDARERVINGRRVPHLTALDLKRLAQYGLHASVRETQNSY